MSQMMLRGIEARIPAARLVGLAAIPVFVVGLYVVQRPRIGRLGRLSAFAYAYSYVFFTATVVYALIHGTSEGRASP